MNQLYSFILSLMIFGTAEAAPVEIKQHFLDGILIIQADDNLVDVVELKRYLVVHPVAYDQNYYISTGLQLCIRNDPAYKSCGSRDIHAKYFLENAKHNLERDRQRLAYLDSLRNYPELHPLVTHFSSSLRFGIWLNERLLAYLQTWDPTALEQNYGNLEVVQKTKDILQKLKATTSVDSRWELSMNEWHNAVNNLYRNSEAEIPAEVWNKFVRKYHIQESIKFDQID